MTALEQDVSLRGSIAHFMNVVASEQPQQRAVYREYLSDFAKRWLDAGYPDQLGRVATNWIKAYLVSVDDREAAQTALNGLFFWAQREHLITTNPMEYLSNNGVLI